MKSFDIDEYNSRECQVHNHGFYLGEQSKQAEVDELRKRIDDFKLRAHHIGVQRIDIGAFYDYEKNRANRLQERINEALIELEALSLLKTVNSNNAIKILKGNKDETGLN